LDKLKEWFVLGNNMVVGLDVGTSSIRMAHMVRNGQSFEVAAVASEDIVSEPHEDELMHKSHTTAAIRRCHKKLGVKTKYMVCGVSGPEVAARSFSLPAVPPDKLEVAVVAEAADVCPFNVRQNCFDYQLAVPVGRKSEPASNTHSGILVAATNVIVNDRKHVVESAGLQCALMDVNGLAMVNLFDECETAPVGRTVVLLNVGASSVNMVITGESTLPFVRDSSHGANAIISQIAKEKNLSQEVVRSVLTGTVREGQDAETVAQGLRSGCARLAKDISETLRYHMTQERSAPVDTVYICGGFSLANGFVETMGSLLNLQGKLWNPFKKLRHAVNAKGLEILEDRGPAFVVAAGLGMRSI
jgi:type IV pilus assembly protein PilM